MRHLFHAVFFFLPLLAADKPKEPPKPLSPAPVVIEDRERLKDLRIKAYQELVTLKEAERRREAADKERSQAQLDLEHETQALAAVNGLIDSETEKLRTKYGAPADLWDIDPQTFAWTHKKLNPRNEATK